MELSKKWKSLHGIESRRVERLGQNSPGEWGKKENRERRIMFRIFFPSNKGYGIWNLQRSERHGIESRGVERLCQNSLRRKL